MEKDVLWKIQAIADYQFGSGAGDILFPKNVTIKYSPRTGRAKEIFLKGKLIATLQPIYGIYIPAMAGFLRLYSRFRTSSFKVIVRNEVADIIKEGKNVFAKHVVAAGQKIQIEDEVAVTDEKGSILALGKAALNGKTMASYRKGIAVKVRHGTTKSKFKKLSSKK